MHHLDRLLIPLVRLARDDDGQALVEYALILFLIAFVCFVALGALGGQTSSLLQAVVNDF